jgi:hypothetical protein
MAGRNFWAAWDIQCKRFIDEVLQAGGKEQAGQFVRKIIARHETFSDFQRLYL